MPTDRPALPFRDDTLLGVCEGLGEEFGFRPNYLRVILAALLLWSPVVAIGGYLALGVVLAASRLIVRDRAPAAAAPDTPATAGNNAEAPLPLAA